MIISLSIPLLVGWIWGSLVNYLADVLPAGRKLIQPACPKCKSAYPWIYYLLLRACPHCSQKRTPRAWMIQIILPVFSILVWLFPRPILPYALAMLLLSFFILVAVIDMEHRVILHQVSIFGAVIGLFTGLFLRSESSMSHGVASTLLGGLAGFGILLALYYLGILYARRMAKKRGLPKDEVALGFGDVNLAGILGLMLGWPAISACLFLAILGGGIVSLIIILRMFFTKRYQAFTAIPYAPFLLLAAAYILFS